MLVAPGPWREHLPQSSERATPRRDKRPAVVQKQFGVIAIMSLTHRFQSWLDHTLKNGVYEVQGSEIVCGRGRRPDHRLPISAVRAWQIYPEMGFDVVTIDLTGGQQFRWIDKYDDLISILRRVAPEREADV
jgi:hypothetical protein